MKNTLKIISLSSKGHGVAENGWHILGAFPKDIVIAKPYKTVNGITYAELIQINKHSEFRNTMIKSKPFFDANAPWRYLTLSQENTEKLSLVKNTFSNYSIDINSNIVCQISRDSLYRNKASYAFTRDSSNSICFALFTRGVSDKGKIKQEENILVHEEITAVGKVFLNFFNERNVPIDTLKYLTLRYSYSHDSVVAQILVTETSRKKIPWKKSDMLELIEKNKKLQGIQISSSPKDIRSSITTKEFYSVGNIVCSEKVGNLTYQYHPSQFFQIYPEAFFKILDDCEYILSTINYCSDYELLDMFAGVGIIGLHLSKHVKKVHGVEQSPLSKEYAEKNATINNIKNYTFSEGDVASSLAKIKKKQILVVDPTRSGLGNKTISKIITTQPEHIIYISCNPETQAEDYHKLKSIYTIEWSQAYNLFPKTPHVEHVVYLKIIE